MNISSWSFENDDKCDASSSYDVLFIMSYPVWITINLSRTNVTRVGSELENTQRFTGSFSTLNDK